MKVPSDAAPCNIRCLESAAWACVVPQSPAGVDATVPATLLRVDQDEEMTGLSANHEHILLSAKVQQCSATGSFDCEEKERVVAYRAHEHWLQELSALRFWVLRHKGTEPPHSGEYNSFFPGRGSFRCAGCGLPLYAAASKQESLHGWPAFDKSIHSPQMGSHVCVVLDQDLVRLELVCGRCEGHIGHIGYHPFGETNEEH